MNTKNIFMLGKMTYILLILFFCTVLQAQTVMYNQEFQVNTYTYDTQEEPTVCGLSGGGFVVCWQSNFQDGDRSGIFGQIYKSSGIKQGEEFQVNTYTKSYQWIPTVCGLSDGGFVVCWESWGQDGDESGIYGQIYKSSGTKRGQEFQVDTYTNSYQHQPSICGLSGGGFVVCWRSYGQDGDESGIYGQIYKSSGIKQGEEFQVNTCTKSDQWIPTVCGLSDGGFVVCWQSWGQDGEGWGIFGQMYYNIGTKRGQEFQVNTYTRNHQRGSSVCALADSAFVVCWTSDRQDGSGDGIFAQIYENNGTKRGEEFRVNTYTEDDQQGSSVSGLSDGGFVVCWDSYNQDGDDYGIFGQMYDSSGAKRGQEFQLNTYTSDYQLRPTVCVLSDGGFVVCWQSWYQDGSSSGIYGKYYLGTPILHLLQSFLLISPVYDATLYSTTANFQWQQASPIHVNFPWELEYTLYLDLTEDFNDPAIFSGINDTTLSVEPLTPGQTYFWKVMAKNIEGDSLWSSETFGFYISPDATQIIHDRVINAQDFKLFTNISHFIPGTILCGFLATGLQHPI